MRVRIAVGRGRWDLEMSQEGWAMSEESVFKS